MQSFVLFNLYFPMGFLNLEGVLVASGNWKLLLFKIASLLYLSHGPEYFLVQILKKHCPACLPSQTPDISYTHGAHYFKKLIMPGPKDVNCSGSDPFGGCLFYLHGTGKPLLASTAYSTLKGDE